MVRMAVSYYLILAFSAGPAAFCCCALNSLAASFHAVAVVNPGSPPRPDGLCPLCNKHQNRPTPSPEKAPAPDKEPPGGCPCKGLCPAAVLPDVVTDNAREWSPEQVAAGVSAPELPAIFSPDFAARNRPGVPPGLRDGPWLSAGDLLSTHHVIRC